jgi:hypothetical protein
MIGSALLMRGYEGIISKAVFKLLVLPIKLFIQIKQVNCKVIVWKKLLVVVNGMCRIKSINQIKENMLKQVMRLMTVSFNVAVALPVKERRLLWTMYNKLHVWFMRFKEFVIKFGYAVLDGNGELVFLSELLRRIPNMDEMETLLKGSNTQAGGGPAMSYWDPHLPMIMRSVAKLSLKCTCIFGSSISGECMLVHFQLPTSATKAECKKLQNNFCQHIKKTHRQFGHNKVPKWPCGIRMNKKGGMNDKEFEKYINNKIIPLFPDMEDTSGKRVLLKTKSGQQTWSQLDGSSCLLLFLRPLPLLRPAQHHFRAAGDRPQLWLLQECDL